MQSSFRSLAWPWSGRSLPKGNQWECWDPGQGPKVVRIPVHLPPHIWPTQSLTRLISCHMAGWLANCSWQAVWLTDCLLHKMSTLPQVRHTPSRCIWWPSWVTYTLSFQEYFAVGCPHFSHVNPNAPLIPHTLPAGSHFLLTPLVPLPAPNAPTPIPVQESSCQEWYHCRWAWHVISLWVRLLFFQMYPQPPHAPSKSPARGIWWPREVLTEVLLTWAHVLGSVIDCLEFSRVLCNRLYSFFIYNHPMAPQCPCTLVSTLIPPPHPSTGI